MNTEVNKPAASVILPVYNAGKYLDEAIESILAQTFTDFGARHVGQHLPQHCMQTPAALFLGNPR